ncbi:MAG: hypothetical protein ABIQ31_12875 [Ferruginibacter sp.]
MLKLYLLLISITGIVGVSYSQSNNCASLTPEQSDLGYKRLSNRCEGFYNPKLSGNLQVVSFITGGNIEFTWNEKTELMISGIDSAASPLHVRAVSLPHNVFYQMDALLDKSKSLNWAVGPYVFRRGIKPGQLGMYGWAGEEDNKIFSPVSVSEKGITTTNKSDIILKIRTVLDLSNFRWNLSRTIGMTCDSVINPFQNFAGDMTAGSIIEIKIPRPAKNISVFCLEIQYRPENKRWQSEILKIKI